MSRPAKPWRRWSIRAAGSVLMLGLLAWLVPIAEVIEGFARVPPWLFAGVLAVFLAGHVAAAAKWRALTGGLPFRAALRAHFAGLAGNLMLPGVAGGDAVRAAIAQAGLRDGGRVVAGALADRLVDMLALACLVAIGALMLAGQGSGALALQVLTLFAAALVGTVYAAPRLLAALWGRLALPGRGLALRLAGALRSIGRKPLLLTGTLALSIAIQGLFVLLAMQLGRAVGLELPPGAWFFAWPLAKLLAVLPISLGGLGLREASLAALLLPFGAEPAQVVTAGLTWQAVLWLAGGLGALVLAVAGGGRLPEPPEAEPPAAELPEAELPEAELPGQGQ